MTENGKNRSQNHSYHYRQVSPLHVYHHASMLLLSDLAYSKYPTASFAVGLMLNSFVHVVLYAYYGKLDDTDKYGGRISVKSRHIKVPIISLGDNFG